MTHETHPTLSGFEAMPSSIAQSVDTYVPRPRVAAASEYSYDARESLEDEPVDAREAHLARQAVHSVLGDYVRLFELSDAGAMHPQLAL